MAIEDIKNTIESDLTELVKKLVQKEEEKYFQYYIGKVISNKDPEKLGKCQILVYGLYDQLPEKDLPWAVPDFTFVGSQVGSFIVPPEGAVVNVRFSMGNIYEPVYTSKCLIKTKLPSNKDKDYPNNLIFFETDNNDSFEINLKTKIATYRSSEGSLIIIDQNGNITVDTSKVKNLTKGKVTVITGTVEIKNDIGATVTPNPLGGPFNSLPYDPITGAVHQGSIVKNTLI